MLITTRSIDDFKTDRKGISPPLAPYLRIVPILFYLGILATLVLNGLFFMRFTQAAGEVAVSKRRTTELASEIKDVETQRAALENEARKASDILTWLDSVRPLQPLVVDITRSIGPESSLVNLRFDRDSENPSQILLSMRLQSEGTRQLDSTLATIANRKFRTFSPQQTLAKGEVDYRVTLLWQDSDRLRPPEEVPPAAPDK